MWRTVLLILSGSAGASLLTLARNLIIARAIGAEAFGVAATFALVMTMIEMTSTLGLQQQIVQSSKGDDPHFQAALQGFQVMRGIIAAVAMFAVARPLAQFLGIPEVAWGYQLMALMPILTALVHFDIYRLNRRMVYGPGVIAVIAPAFLSLLLVWPLMVLFGDWRVMMYAILAQGALMAAVSHLMAEQPYRLSFDRAIMGEGLRFGWPILLNGILMFLVFNGERLLVGREVGMAMLGLFSIGVTLTQTPTLIAGATTQRFFLPQLSALKPNERHSDKDRFDHLSRAAIQVDLMVGALLVLGAIALAAPLIRILLGPEYMSVVPLIVPLTIVQAIRIAKMGGSTATLSCGYTGTMLPAHIIRVLFLPVAWIVLSNGGSVMTIIWIAAAAELIGLVSAMAMVWYRLRLRLLPVARGFALMAVLLAVAMAEPMHTARFGLAAPILMVAALTILIWISNHDLRQYISQRRFDGFADKSS